MKQLFKLALLINLGLTACGTNNQSSPPKAQTKEVSITCEQLTEILLQQPLSTSSQLSKSLTKLALRHPEISDLTTESCLDANIQIECKPNEVCLITKKTN